MALVDADDIADVALHALTDDRAPSTDLVLTGPRPSTTTGSPPSAPGPAAGRSSTAA
ncbi:hypothetical protein [Streptomyces sp. E5N91]|uniref:hypothetical protein n=1 Tax=Streptomyces sp. E5N91 TaxID=1851996 RepID=UPI00187D1C06